jgi:hypothetical protein
MTTPKALPNDLIDGLLANYKKPEDLIGWRERSSTPAHCLFHLG